MKIIPVTVINVGLHLEHQHYHVGRLAQRDRKIYFQYDNAFLEARLEISPIHLPLKPELQSFDQKYCDGLPGVFDDSLPDGWGRLLFDRVVRSEGLLPVELSVLDRLAFVGKTGIGALIYEPDYSSHESKINIDLNVLAAQTQMVLEGTAEDALEELLALNGSSAGARPKAMIGVDKTRKNLLAGTTSLTKDYEHWLVKFPNLQDGIDAGAIEYVYGLMAKKAGIIHMPDIHLFSAQKGPGFFAAKRFDRQGEKRLHAHTASGLLHSDFCVPSLDYEDLIALTEVLTRDVREVEKMFQLAVFNVLAHNRDDHGKNFTFLMNEKGQWKVSPAYDLTFSSGPRGEQSTMVMGEGKTPGIAHLNILGEKARLSKKRINEVVDQTSNAINQWESLANEYGVSKRSINLIKKVL